MKSLIKRTTPYLCVGVFFILAVLVLLNRAHGAATYAPIVVNQTSGTMEGQSKFFSGNSNSLWGTVGPQVNSRLVLIDPDADSYASDVGLVDLEERIRVSQFIAGLKNMGKWCDAKLLVSLRTSHQLASGATAISIKGNHCTVVGSPTRSTNGFTFDGGGSAYLTFTNPFSGTISAISAITAFKSTVGTFQAVMSGYGNSPNKSFAVYAHGGPGAGNVTNAIEMTLSSDGSASFTLNAGRYMGDYSVTGKRQLMFNGFGLDAYSSQSNSDLRRTSTGTFSALHNPNTTWNIARTPGGGQGFNGEIAFVGIWEKNLTEHEYLAIRRLYTLTIGRSWAPEINAIVEGDSITAGGGPITNAKLWHQQLLDNAAWGNIIARRNVSEGGTTAATMLSTINSQALYYALDTRYFGKGYFMFNGGLNDLLTVDAATAFTSISQAWSKARASGLRVVAFTITPSASYTGGQNTQRSILNTTIRNATSEWDYLVDLANVANLSDTGNTTYFQSDGVHLTEVGHTQVLNAILAVIPTP